MQNKPVTKNPIEITTRRLLLRPFRNNDIDDVYEYANSTGWSEYLVNIPQPFARGDARKFINRFSNLARWSDLPMFAIVYANKVIGEIYLNLDQQNERAEIGYSLSSDYWGKGIVVEAASAVINWAFVELKINKVCATCDIRNNRSQRVMEKLGMIREGLLRHHLKWAGVFRDEFYYGLLKEEWHK